MTAPLQRSLLCWLGVAVGLSAAAVTGAVLWLSRFVGPPAELGLIAGGMALLCLIMALRCGRRAVAR